MKRFAWLWIALLAANLPAETIKVYLPASHELIGFEYTKDGLTNRGEDAYTIGKQVGVIETGQVTLQAILEKYSWAKKDFSEAEPFYSGVDMFILEDSNERFYIAHLEHVEKITTIDKPWRAAMIELEPRDGMLFGNAYSGSSVRDPNIISQLTEINNSLKSKTTTQP